MGASRRMSLRKIGEGQHSEEYVVEAPPRRTTPGNRSSAPTGGFVPAALVPAADLQPLRRRPVDTADPLGGQSIPSGVANVLRRRRGQGQQLAEPTRASMSDQFGVDLSSVRIHNDAESHHVADAVQSVAFTHGSDIYFSRGQYNPDSSAGQHLLAHELAHVTSAEPAGSGQHIIGRANDPAEAAAETTANKVVAQLHRSYRSPTAPAPEQLAPTGDQSVARQLRPQQDETAVRRMTVNNTNWAAATSATHSAGGGVGVIIVNDGTAPVVVKAGEDFTEEAAVAAKLLKDSATGMQDGWGSGTPEARTVGAAETPNIEIALRAHLSANQLASNRTTGFLDDLHQNKGVMVFGFAAGREIHDVLTNDPQVEADGKGKWSVKQDSVSYKFMTEPGLMGTFGRASAPDILLGNSDRFVGKINFENIMIDTATNSLSFIDNVEANDGAVLRDMPSIGMTGKAGFDFWASGALAKQLAKGQFDSIADDSVTKIIDHYKSVLGLTKGTPGSETDKKKSKRLKAGRDTEKGSLEAALESNKAKMTSWFAQGLARGRDAVLTSLRDPLALTASVSPAKREEVMTSILARRFFLSGMSADDAWAAAVIQAGKMMAQLMAPQQAPQQPPVRPNGPIPQQAPQHPPVRPNGALPQQAPQNQPPQRPLANAGGLQTPPRPQNNAYGGGQ
ncbi:MAG: DUF4157 domain-containing protein [Nakamurella sp.]